MDEDSNTKEHQLESLKQQLEQVRKLQPEATPEAKLPGDAARGAIDFASATAVGSVLGYVFDRWQDTLPWGLLVGLLIGTAAGLKLLFAEEARQKRVSAAKETKND